MCKAPSSPHEALPSALRALFATIVRFPMALSASEQLLIEMINRARLDPEGEAALFGIDLNQGLSTGTLDGS